MNQKTHINTQIRTFYIILFNPYYQKSNSPAESLNRLPFRGVNQANNTYLFK